jgi:pentapeptide repeat protein
MPRGFRHENGYSTSASLAKRISLTLLSGPFLLQAVVTPSSGWSLWIANLANTVIVAQAVALAFGVFQLWASRSERKAAEQRAAAMARKQANYEAWQVINSAQGKGGSGGRIDALNDLVTNSISLAGVCLDGAWLEGVNLANGHLFEATFRHANLAGANLQHTNLERADFSAANLVGADLRGALLRGVTVAGANLGTADLRGADLTDLVDWRSLGSVSYTHIEGVRSAPAGFREWALANGAIDQEAPPSPDNMPGYSSIWRAV